MVQITIDDKQQIANIIVNVKNILISEHAYTTEAHQQRARKELEERGYDMELVDEYIGYIE